MGLLPISLDAIPKMLVRDTAAVNTTKQLFSELDISKATGIATSSFGALITVTTILLANEKILEETISQEDVNDLVENAYDFVIGGAGPAGSVLAYRLSVDGGYRVLLLEAGGDPLLTNSIPFLAPYNMNRPQTEWMHNSIPQKHCGLGNSDQRLRLCAGKSLGGSSNLNWMIYMRGNPQDFDHWALLSNDSTWRYENVLPYFKKLEDYHGNFPSDYHGKDGPLHISKQRFEPMVEDWLKGGQELGISTRDPNALQTSSMFPIDVNMKEGRRYGAYNAYLKPALSNGKLKVLRRALVDKVFFDDDQNAIGLSFWHEERNYNVTASKEVVISSGALGTPQILQRSGIGSSKLLKKLGIEVVADLPGVGQNLQDHVNTLLGPFIMNDSVSFLLDRDVQPTDVVKYTVSGEGPYTWNIVSGMSMYNTTNYTESWPNICVFHSPIGIHQSYTEDIERQMGLKKGFLDSYVQDYEGRDATHVLINIGRPKSTGTVRIASTSPEDPPLINPNFYSDSGGEDISSMVEAMTFFTSMFETSQTWRKYGTHLILRHLPGCEKHELKSKQYFECFARHITSTTWHYSGTAKFGKDSDRMAVLDSNLRVRGVKRLRVVDTSAFPAVPNANTHAPVLMLAEKAADLILKEHA